MVYRLEITCLSFGLDTEMIPVKITYFKKLEGKRTTGTYFTFRLRKCKENEILQINLGLKIGGVVKMIIQQKQ